jgi:hypothetical protein
MVELAFAIGCVAVAMVFFSYSGIFDQNPLKHGVAVPEINWLDMTIGGGFAVAAALFLRLALGGVAS